MRVSFDNGPAFRKPRDLVRADTLAEVVPALERLEALRRQGYWLAGFMSYEAGYAFSPKLTEMATGSAPLPLMVFGAYEAPTLQPSGDGTGTLTRATPFWSASVHAAAIRTVKDYIAAGEIYQANLTFPFHATATGSPVALAAALAARQKVGHGAVVELEDAAIICRSPELFFEVENGEIRARPMKGTAPRGDTPAADRSLRDGLTVSDKDMAENLMIVDLLRNDISRVARIGSVRVPALFEIETYTTVHQMVSRIHGTLREGVGLPELMAALFPCGSVTGAPKLRAMQILAEVESGPRGAYCGTLGWVAPSGDMRFGVAIRTLTLTGDAGQWDVRLDVGGGVVHDSTATGEYEEALWKARFADLSRPG